MKVKLFLTIMFFSCLLSGLTNSEIEMIYKKELWDIAQTYEKDIVNMTYQNPKFEAPWKILIELARLQKDTLQLINLYSRKSYIDNSMQNAINALSLSHDFRYKKHRVLADSLSKQFKKKINRDVIQYYTTYNQKFKKDLLKIYGTYSIYMEQWAKEQIDEISTESDHDARIKKIRVFLKEYPHSQYKASAYHYQLYSYRSQENDKKYYSLILDLLKIKKNAMIKYWIAYYSIDPRFRKNHYGGQANLLLLNQAERSLNEAIELVKADDVDRKYYCQILPWSREYFLSKIYLEKARINYYRLLHQQNKYGDEDQDKLSVSQDSKDFKNALSNLKKVKFKNNNNGEIAGWHFWYGKLLKASNQAEDQEFAIQHFIECLVLSAPRNPFEKSCTRYLNELYESSKSTLDFMSWVRNKKKYEGPIFEEVSEKIGFKGVKASRVAWGDYDNDGWDDLLLDGNMIFRNNQNLSFTMVSDDIGPSLRSNNGGLWADFNRDGLLDFMTMSSSEYGEMLYLQKGGKFVRVDEKAGSINTYSPTEGAAWVDVSGKGFPDLYLANYEIWGEIPAFSDHYFVNKNGHFEDDTLDSGLINPWYSECAGRGVAPADYDNDGETDILVCNYRLNRNFLFSKSRKENKWRDTAHLTRLSGNNNDGYYGHSIGADWGDFDNDGDLDVFIANLAHPRFLDFSDISQFMRNDGKKMIKIDSIEIEYTEFTNITARSGITFDETHSDPSWFDADNDGDLDLYISSIYPNERSYLYLNQGNEEFVDVSFLSGIRSYNAWGNAVSDINQDGLLDLFVCSGDGVKVFLNQSKNDFHSMMLNASWIKDRVFLSEGIDLRGIDHSPAFGSRVKLFYHLNGQEFSQIRELQSAKGTSSQASQNLHFGLNKGKVIRAELWFKNELLDVKKY